MTIKEAWHKFDKQVLCDDKNFKILLGAVAFIWFVIVIYTARHPKTVRGLLEPWAYFTAISLAVTTGGTWIGISIAEKLKIDDLLEGFFKWFLIFGLVNWALFMICLIATGSVLLVIDLFGI